MEFYFWGMCRITVFCRLEGFSSHQIMFFAVRRTHGDRSSCVCCDGSRTVDHVTISHSGVCGKAICYYWWSPEAGVCQPLRVCLEHLLRPVVMEIGHVLPRQLRRPSWFGSQVVLQQESFTLECGPRCVQLTCRIGRPVSVRLYR